MTPEALLISAPAELPALVRAARPLVRELLPAAEDGAATLEQATPLLQCLRDKLVPAFGRRIDDGTLTTGTTVLQELMSLSTGLASSGATFDANGWLVRLAVTLGPRSLTTGSASGIGPFSASTAGIEGARPVWYGRDGKPPFLPDARCADQPVPDLRAASRPVPTTRAAGTPAAATPPTDAAGVDRLRARLRRWLGPPDAGKAGR
ncbi:hypothetical protein AB0L40_26780 [Patulibacter sp. NPDC049589]|uniref:hypothetical protein n=1 Tax=Patulibacter sp. NPDC049589 TaxID=3154731 RepID=UPI003433F3F4